jgi:hypothetical protein
MMSDNTAGLSLEEEGDDFILSVTGTEGGVSKVRLTEAQVLTLIQSAPAFRDRIVLRRSPEGADVSAVVVTPVSHIGVQPDSLGESVLITFQSTTRGRLTFALDPRGVQILLEHLPAALAEIVSAKRTRQ